MRKSERIRLLELEVVRLGLELEYMKAIVGAVLDSESSKVPDLDAGKWYNKKTNRPDIPNN